MRISDWSSDLCSSDLAPACCGTRPGPSRRAFQERPVLHVAGEHLDELRVESRAPHRQRVADDPQHHARQPLLQPDPDRGGQRAVDDRQRPRRATEQDRHGQRPVQRHLESRQQPAQATTAPPAKEKNDRKNEDAANAIDSPNTIWISRRNPPAVSPKAKVKPVTMMMITAMIRATGPWIDSSKDSNGASHGMLEPAARSEEHTSELQSLMRISYAVFCLKKKKATT